jgi:hypothetical protein
MSLLAQFIDENNGVSLCGLDIASFVGAIFRSRLTHLRHRDLKIAPTVTHLRPGNAL